MSKIIIENKSKASDRVAVLLVDVVLKGGFISGEKQYCWASSFKCSYGVDIFARKTRGDTHSFLVVDCEN